MRKKKTSSKNSSRVKDSTTQYALDVLDGKILTGKPVRQACERHLWDIEAQKKTGLRWDPELAEWVFQFFSEVLTVEKAGQVAKFDLEAFEKFIIGSIFGWLNPDGTRRFRTAYVELGKGNGKSPMAAGIGHYGLVADGEMSPEVYSAAVTTDQAKIAWRDAKIMAERSPELAKVIEIAAAALYFPSKNGIFRPVSSEHRGLDGKRVHIGIIDELHEHPTSQVVDKIRASTKARRNALIFEITNSGSEIESVCYHHHEYSLKILEGIIEDPAWFAYVCALDEGDDWLNDESCWIKANPGLHTILPISYLREQVREAQGMPSKRNIVARLNFCVWTQQHTLWIPVEDWNACDNPSDETSLLGQPCWGGLDLSTKLDLTAFVLAFRRDFEPDYPIEVAIGQNKAEEPKRHEINLNFSVDLKCWFYIPEETMHNAEKRDRVPYSLWAQQGYLFPTPGNIVDYDFILDQIVNEIAPKYSIQQIGFDPHNATQFSIHLTNHGFECIEVRQGALSMSEPSKIFEALVKAKRLRHSGNPILRWNVSNVAVKEDKKENIFPFKQQQKKRIDGVIAAIMAISRLMVSEPETSVYETPGESIWL